VTARSFHDDVLHQPDNLVAAAGVFLPALREADLRSFRQDSLVFTAMGASFFATVPAIHLLRAAGRRAVAVPASEVLEQGGERLGAGYIGLSQSGQSAETVEVVRRVEVPKLALTRTGEGPLAQAADLTLPIGSDADAGVSVLTYTASLFACVALAAALGAEKLEVEVGWLAELVEGSLGRAVSASERFAARLTEARAVDVVGTGVSFASAGYGALITREAARLPAAGFDTGQYLHGPIEAAQTGVGAMVLGSEREVRLASDLASFGLAVLLVTTADVNDADGLEIVRLPHVPPALRPILEAVPLQLAAEQLGLARGITPGSFRHHQDDTKLEAP
jgi:glutamine---fructose-6-phosphate transaminase (isomerizing)